MSGEIRSMGAGAPPPLYLRVSDVLGMLRVSDSTLRRMVKAGRFPKPVMLHSQIKAWRVSDVQQWAAGIKPN
jgi:prophage regulatory protein